MQEKNLTRRGFIKTASGLALAPALGWVPGMAHAAEKEIVVGTWGGDYQNLCLLYTSPSPRD